MTGRLFRLISSLTLILNSCTSTQVLQEAKFIHPINKGELIALLGDTDETSEFNDSEVYDCISDGMLDINPKLQIMKPVTFRSNLYPYFSISTTPHSQEEFKNLLSKPLIQQRIKTMGVHYLVTLLEARKKTDGHGGILCGGGGPGGGCFGLYWSNNDTLLNAQIWNLQSVSVIGNVKTQATGTGVLPAFVLPIPVYIPATTAASCQELGEQIAKAFSGITH